MKITNGQIAPDFSATDIYGKNIKLSGFRGKKIVLSFYRNVNCPFCNRRVHRIMGMNYKFQRSGAQLLFLFESSNEKLMQSAFHKGISPWPLIGDPERKIYQTYGVEPSMLKMMRTMLSSSLAKAKQDTNELGLPEDKDATMSLIPADFFINEDFTVEKAHYGQHLDDHITVEAIKAFTGI